MMSESEMFLRLGVIVAFHAAMTSPDDLRRILSSVVCAMAALGVVAIKYMP